MLVSSPGIQGISRSAGGTLYLMGARQMKKATSRVAWYLWGGESGFDVVCPFGQRNDAVEGVPAFHVQMKLRAVVV